MILDVAYAMVGDVTDVGSMWYLTRLRIVGLCSLRELFLSGLTFIP